MSISFLDIIDKYLERWRKLEANKIPIERIEPEMANPNEDFTVEWKTWLLIKSKVKQEEIDELEETIGYPLPKSYREFLQHRHFYDLQIGEASFCRHEVNGWRSSQTDLVFRSYPREFLIDKGYIPFATWSDWGMLCFDTSKPVAEHNYPVVLWDHERWNVYAPVAINFDALIHKLDLEADNS